MSSRYGIQTNSNLSKTPCKHGAFSSIACNGVYILLGNDPEAIENTWCYIGKTENFVERLRDHDKKETTVGKGRVNTQKLLSLACIGLLTRGIGVI